MGREAGAVVVADREGWEAVTAVGAVAVAGGEGRETGTAVAAGGEGWEAEIAVDVG